MYCLRNVPDSEGMVIFILGLTCFLIIQKDTNAFVQHIFEQ